MRKLVYYIATTMDGFIAHQDGSIDGFLMEGEHADHFMKTIYKEFDAVIMGRKTYEFGFQYGLEPGQPAYKGLKHYIVSESMEFDQSEDVILINETPSKFISDLKHQPGKSIWLCGGGELAGTLLKSKLVDEIILKINPIVFGDGRKLLGKGAQTMNWSLKKEITYENGVVEVCYAIQ